MGTSRLFSLAASVLLVLAGAAYAAEGDAPPPPPPNVDPAKRGTSPKTEGVAQAVLADQMARHADRNKDVFAMLAAIRLMTQVAPRPAKLEMRSEGAKAAAADAKGGGAAPRDSTLPGLIARAKQYAGGRNDLNGLVDELSKSAAKARDDGPARATHRIAGGASDVYTLVLRANEPVMVALVGEGVSDLDLTVEDDAGNRICASAGAGDDELCRWTPRRNGNFRVRVRNTGTVVNEYRLWSN